MEQTDRIYCLRVILQLEITNISKKYQTKFRKCLYFWAKKSIAIIQSVCFIQTIEFVFLFLNQYFKISHVENARVRIDIAISCSQPASKCVDWWDYTGIRASYSSDILLIFQLLICFKWPVLNSFLTFETVPTHKINKMCWYQHKDMWEVLFTIGVSENMIFWSNKTSETHAGANHSIPAEYEQQFTLIWGYFHTAKLAAFE